MIFGIVVLITWYWPMVLTHGIVTKPIHKVITKSKYNKLNFIIFINLTFYY